MGNAFCNKSIQETIHQMSPESPEFCTSYCKKKTFRSFFRTRCKKSCRV